MFDYQVKIDCKGRLQLPGDILQHYDLHPGDSLDIIERPDGVLEIRSTLSDSSVVDDINALENGIDQVEIVAQKKADH